MKVVVFLVCLGIFLASFLLMGYAFAVPGPWNAILFGAGVLAVGVSLAIPFHLLERFD